MRNVAVMSYTAKRIQGWRLTITSIVAPAIAQAANAPVSACAGIDRPSSGQASTPARAPMLPWVAP